MSKLTGKVIFLTGGASGIGAMCARAYQQAGASLMIMDWDAFSLARLQNELGEGHHGYVGDVSHGEDVENALKKTVQVFGKIDVIHNNAGLASPSKSLDETSETEWNLVMAVNLKSVYWTTRYGIEELKKTKGCILNTSSMVGEIGQEIHAAYVASKGAMNALTKAMALDYASFGIRVNAVCPAGVWTPMLRVWASQQPDPPSVKKYLDDIHPLGYCPEGDVIADTAVFLISEDARFVTGCIMPVSGGAELGYRRS
jgi:meso-butanediol dehydrogenase / (S,S)-butanediol dehydrogenase / diacetyl reductase